MNPESDPYTDTLHNSELFQQLGQDIIKRQPEIESWLQHQWHQTPAPFYASVDLRNAGYKLAPVDTNLFPAGFNNLHSKFILLCIDAIQMEVQRLPGEIKNILIIPENHTRNLPYLESLTALQKMISDAGFKVRLGTIQSDIQETRVIEINSTESVCLEPIQRHGDKISVGDFVPDLIVLNNDLSSGSPDILDSLEQTVTPIPSMGWSNRLKSAHFSHYRQIATEFAEHIGIDPWLIDPLFRNCGAIDFMQREGGECLSRNIDELLQEIQKKYLEYEIKCRPYLIVKADSGTYGMGIMTVHSVNDIKELNRKQRTRMSTIKGGQKVTKVIIQEGVYTHETWGQTNMVAEPVIYMIGRSVVGGFYRAHEKRAINENLNMPGMLFESLPVDEFYPASAKNRFYAYGVIARLALLAAAREMQAQT